MSKIKIIWADDEIEVLKPHLLFLDSKGYQVHPVTNGHDAINAIKADRPEVVFLDESMPGLSGLETLARIKEYDSQLPVVMITKNETENIMETAIGAQIADYLIKPVHPNQILLTLKKILDNKRLVTQATASAYQQQFASIFADIQTGGDYDAWFELYKRLVFWELELDASGNSEMQEVLANQKAEANLEFNKYIIKNYLDWVQGKKKGPVTSCTLFREKILPRIDENACNFVVVIDNLRFDQWKAIQPIISESYTFVDPDYFSSILPPSTHYSRNAIFAGLMPSDIERRFPSQWKNDADEGGKNLYEAEFLADQLQRYNKKYKHSYTKITNHQNGLELVDNIHNLLNNTLNVIVYNFVDMLSHARTEMEVLKELASDEAAYRSITKSWFEYSPLWQALRRIEDKKINLIITTDHGTVRVQHPSKVVGDRETTTNLRYKHGRNLQYNPKEVFVVNNPIEAKLPRPNISSAFIFARENSFFVYLNNYNHFVNYYKNTFQHGGISLEEMIVPVVQFTNK
ncbi:MAG: PglZ domain-containing protein [Sphingobacteriales bacterium]|nr:PglZ domain-containing protein [Sphingobacteriales bacterium]